MIEMKYVQRVVGDDGIVRLYFRRAGFPRAGLKSPWPEEGQEAGSELEREVEALIVALTPARALPGTLRGALNAYELESADFKALAESTRTGLYLPIIKELDEDFGQVPISQFTAPRILQLRDIWASRGYRAANVRLQVLKNVLWPSIVAGMIEGGNPFELISGVRRPADAPEPHILWPERDVIAAIEAAVAEERYGLARAIAIARYAGPRREDITKLSTAARQDGRIRYLTGKRKQPVDVEEDPLLAHWLSTIPAWQPATARQGRKVAAGRASVQALRLVFNLSGQAYTPDGLHNALKDHLGRLFKAGRIATHAYDLHGMRHTRGVELALAECTDAEIAAQLGHRSAASAAIYRRQADRIRLSDNASAKIRELRNAPKTPRVKSRVK